MQLKVEKLTEQAFAKFGKVLGEPMDVDPNFRDSVADNWLGFTDLMGIGSIPGRQVTFLKIRARPVDRDKIEKHETSAEAFIPLEGTSILTIVAPEDTDQMGRPDMSKAKAFLIDGSKGVLMRPGAWHAIPYTLTDTATFLVLVDDAIITKNDLHITSIEPVAFDL